ncbi:MAG: glycosyltransferase [Actinomycetaceae bacterium]|nr:glycosyltransferase [Actinomycetaceae bacterium]
MENKNNGLNDFSQDHLKFKKVELSVLIPVRNRPPERLEMAIRSLKHAVQSCSAEIVVSDYGSDNADVNHSICNEERVKYVYTDANIWSRSRCLNVVLEKLKSQYFLSSDIDMIWEPGSITEALATIKRNPGSFFLFQHGDLPEQLTESILDTQDFSQLDWAAILSLSHLRPRWGHGMLLAERAAAEKIGFYDHRMIIYGAEDLDMTKRLRLSGQVLLWSHPGRPNGHHVWHPKETIVRKDQEEFNDAVKHNRSIYRYDRSLIRSINDVFRATPLVSIVIRTAGRPEYLKECLYSISWQTFPYYEVIVVDDGNNPDTEELLKEYGDDRFIYVKALGKGISAARNQAFEHCKGEFIAVMDDDDIMLPTSLEESLRAFEPGIVGVTGYVLNFDNQTGETVPPWTAQPDLKLAFRNESFPAHTPCLIRRKILEVFRYDEVFSSAEDNNIALRMLRNSTCFKSTNTILTLRRLHQSSLLETNSTEMENNVQRTLNFFLFNVSAEQKKSILEQSSETQNLPTVERSEVEKAICYLPDHLQPLRPLRIYTDEEDANQTFTRSYSDYELTVIYDRQGKFVYSVGVLPTVELEDLRWLRDNGFQWEFLLKTEHLKLNTLSVPQDAPAWLFINRSDLCEKLVDVTKKGVLYPSAESDANFVYKVQNPKHNINVALSFAPMSDFNDNVLPEGAFIFDIVRRGEAL